MALGVGGAARSAPSDEKAAVDRRLARAQDRLRQARDRESVLTGEVQGYTDRIRVLEARLAPLRARSERLDGELASLRARLDELNLRLAAERRRLAEAEADLARRRLVLGRRLREIYVREDPDPILVLLESGSISAAIDTAELLQSITDRDGNVAEAVQRRVGEVRPRARPHRGRAGRGVVVRATDRGRRVRRAGGPGRPRDPAGGHRASCCRAGRRCWPASRATGGISRPRPRASRAGPGSSPTGSASPRACPVPQRERGGGRPVRGRAGLAGERHDHLRLRDALGPDARGHRHRRVERRAIAASAAGTVIVAGWVGGYGNMVVIDHGGGISTGYGHLSSLAVSVGQAVGQGTVVGGMGTTGHSTGVHLHFEVRVNGTAVNPLGYL